MMSARRHGPVLPDPSRASSEPRKAHLGEAESAYPEGVEALGCVELGAMGEPSDQGECAHQPEQGQQTSVEPDRAGAAISVKERSLSLRRM